MARLKHGETLPPWAREALRARILRDGVSATAKALETGREQVLAGAGELPLLRAADAAFIVKKLRGEKRCA